jgi:hypothetical protein
MLIALPIYLSGHLIAAVVEQNPILPRRTVVGQRIRRDRVQRRLAQDVCWRLTPSWKIERLNKRVAHCRLGSLTPSSRWVRLS